MEKEVQYMCCTTCDQNPSLKDEDSPKHFKAKEQVIKLDGVTSVVLVVGSFMENFNN